jgi:hypothetical protein
MEMLERSIWLAVAAVLAAGYVYVFSLDSDGLDMQEEQGKALLQLVYPHTDPV